MNLRYSPTVFLAGLLSLAAGCAHGPAIALQLSVPNMPDQLQAGQEAFLWVELKNLRKEKLFFSDAWGVNHVVDYEDGSGYAGPIVTGPHECRDRFKNKHILLPGQSYYVAHELVPKRAGKATLRLTFSLELLDDDGACTGPLLHLETGPHPIVIQ
jgi:hypothetical protein